jgi:transposase
LAPAPGAAAQRAAAEFLREGHYLRHLRRMKLLYAAQREALLFFYSPDRGGAHPERHLAGYAGLMQADAYAGFGRLYEASRQGGPIIEAACWAHGRRKFFDLARLSKAPIAAEAVNRVDVLFAIEREINGLAAQERYDQGNQLLPQPLGRIYPLP